MKDFLLYVVLKIVDHPEGVSVDEEANSGSINLYLSVHREDMGKVIGKEGRIIRAIRDLTRICAIKNNVRGNVVLREG